MSKYIQNFYKFRPLLNELVARDIKTKYRKSILGVLWTVLNPLMMMVILSIVFSKLLRFEVENFPVYILCGQLIFNFYTEATNNAMTAVLHNAMLIKKIYIPKYLFVVSRILSSVINVLASFAALILVMIVTKIELHLTILLAVIPLAMIIGFSFGVGLILSVIAVKFRDIMHLYSVFTTGLLYLTPVIYPMSLLSGSGKVEMIVKLNPLTNILEMFRGVVMYNTLPTFFQIMLGTVEVLVVVIIGLYTFYKNQDNFILNV